ncbi:MAG: type I pantothenate kinase, partial [Lentilitoribacter sp.]
MNEDVDNQDHIGREKYSPFRAFSAKRWSEFRAATPLTLSEDDVKRLRSLNDPVDLNEIERIYLSLSRLLSAHVEMSQGLFAQRRQFLNLERATQSPFIIGIAG